MASKAVNRPTDVRTKEQDVNNKLQLYGIYTAFANGKVPSNKQIDIALNSALASEALSSPSKKLSAEGQRLVADLRDVIEKAKLLVLTKNEGNLLQDFIWQTQQISGGGAQTPNAPVDKATAQQHGSEALEGLRTLGTLIISNGQFRKLLSDAGVLFRSMVGDAAQNVAGRVRPSDDQLNQIDEPAEDNTWHDVPDMSRESLKSQVRQQFNSQKPFGRSGVQRAAEDAAQAANAAGSADPADLADAAARGQQGAAPGIDAEEAGVRAGYDALRQQASENVPQETKDRARRALDSSKDYWNKKVPKERRDQTIWRLKKMVVEIQGHQDYMRAVDTLLRLAEEYGGHSRSMASQGKGAVKGARADDSLQIAEADLTTLIERFANGTSLDDLFDSINRIYKDADQDPRLKDWFRRLDGYVRKCLREQGFIMQDAATDEWGEIYGEGHFLLRERYRDHTDRILDEFRFIGRQFDEDPQNKALGQAVQKLFLDLGNDESGRAKFKPHLVRDLTEVILPGIFENVRYVPIPRIEYTDAVVDAVVENLVIEGDNLAPNVFELGSDNYWRWGRKKIANKKKNRAMLSVTGIQMDLRDVSYYVRKKQGFPSLTDQGVCDIFLGGDGLSFKVDMENADEADPGHFFKVNKVSVNVKNMNIKLKRSKHKLLFNLFKPMLFRVVRPAIQKALEKQIRDSIHQLDAVAFKVHQEARRAQEDFERNPDPENAQTIYQRYASAINKQLMQGKQKKDESAADKRVNMAVTQHDSIFKNISLPGGISSKATEYKELAAKGEKWESPVFSIGSARETANLPKVEAVRRKPHPTAQGGVREGGRSAAASGFANEVDRSFDSTNGFTNGAPFANQYKQEGANGHTTLGSQNPVLTGQV